MSSLPEGPGAPGETRTPRQRRIVRKPDPRAIEEAARVTRELELRDFADVDVVLIGAYYGVAAVVRDLGNEEAHLVRSGERAIVSIARRVWEAGDWRFPFLHELGHWFLHRGHDDLARVTSKGRTSAKRSAESGASDFAGLLLAPHAWVARRWDLTSPGLDVVRAVGAAAGVRTPVAALRVLQMTSAPRAVVLSRAGVVEWWAETPAFGARVRAARAVPAGSEAARLHDARGGSGGGELGESWRGEVAGEAVREGADDVVVSWLRG